MRCNRSVLLLVLGAFAAAAVGTTLGYFLADTRSTRDAGPVGLSSDGEPPRLPDGSRPGTGPKPLPGAVTGRRALLVGCTKYDHLGENWQLTGPANDVALMKQLLVEKFGFDPRNIVCLTENERGAETRPTRANIDREFRRLAESALEGDQVFVLLAGHGSRQPESDPPHPVHPEPDGIDEVFLPADAKKAAPTQNAITNGIVDDEIGEWLKAITLKKAYVCAVFDCCHSGNITRGSEVTRDVPPRELLREGALEEARKRAGDRAEKAGQKVADKRSGWLADSNEFLITVSACRANETTPEAPLPAGARDAKYYGLLTYTMCEVLTQTTAPLTYAELVHRVQVKYAGRPAGAPTPTVEGTARDREVLGTKTWVGRSNIVLRKGTDRYTVNAGDLHGVTAGSVLSVEGPPGTPGAGKRLGFVRVVTVKEGQSAVEPVEYDKTPAPAELPDLAVCRVVFTDYGAKRIRLAVEGDDATRQKILAALGEVADPKVGKVTIVPKPAEADWLIRAAGGSPELVEASANRPPWPLPAASDPTFTSTLEAALERVYRARNLLLVASRADSMRGGSAVQVEVEILTHKSDNAPGVPAVRVDGVPVLKKGEFVSYRIRNNSDLKIDVTLLIVGTDYGISRFFPQRGEVAKACLDARGTFDTPPPYGEVGAPFGPEQMVVIAVKSQLPQADFGSLAQPGLQRNLGADESKAFRTPLGQLLESATSGTGSTRGVTRAVETEMGLRVINWVTVPEPTRK